MGVVGPRGFPGKVEYAIHDDEGWDFVMKCRRVIEGLSSKYAVDQEEIAIGSSHVPPSDSSILVYLSVGGAFPIVYARKNKQPTGRWVYMEPYEL